MDKETAYQELLKQIIALTDGEDDLIASLGNVAAAIHSNFQFHWTGFYLVKGKQLVLGPFQGPVACTRINYGKGVCGTAWADEKLISVPDVHQFDGHIACSSFSNSEIVVPLFNKDQKIWAVLDIDSIKFNDFDKIDETYLTKISEIISTNLYENLNLLD